MIIELIGIILFAVSLYMNYANIVLWNPVYSFLVQESFSALGASIITRTIIHRRSRRRKK